MLFNSLSHWDQLNQRNLSRLPRSESVWGEMGPTLWSMENYSIGSIFHWDQINQINYKDQKDQIDQKDQTTEKTERRDKRILYFYGCPSVLR